MEKLTDNIKWTDEIIIDMIRKLRNDLIKDFLDERFLQEYLREKYNVRSLSKIQIEFIKKDLKELLITPVNIAHYQAIIMQIKESDSASLSTVNEELFYRDIERMIKMSL